MIVYIHLHYYSRLLIFNYSTFGLNRKYYNTIGNVSLFEEKTVCLVFARGGGSLPYKGIYGRDAKLD
jgi:hypothetical protein